MKRILLIMFVIAFNQLIAQTPEFENRDYDFRIKQATQFIPKKFIGYTYDTITHKYSSIEVYPKSKKIIIDYTDQDKEVYTIREKQSTYKNNRTFWCKYDGEWYTFSFVKIDKETYHLNIESIQNKLSVSFLLKEK